MSARRRRDEAQRELGQVGTAGTTSKRDSTPSALKAALLAGHEILLTSYPPSDRAQVIGALAALRDELPISCRWLTLRESHLSETRLRARAYRIRGEFLRGLEVQHV